LLSISCNKTGGGGGTTTPVQEPAVSFSIDASNGSIIPGSSFAVIVTLTSAMPSAQGIKIEASVTDQTNSTAVSQNAPVISTSAKNSVTLINLPQQHWCNAVIKVSSVATGNNTASQSFTVVYK
jgi:hypothetical protein